MSKPDIYQEVTDKIIDLLDKIDPENYEAPFAQLAAQGIPENPTTGKIYQGINILCFNQQDKSFPSNKWATFKQWKDAGAQVKKGEKSSRVVFYKTLSKTDVNEAGEEQETKIPMLRLYNVFNAHQVEGFENEENAKLAEINLVNPIENVDQFCKNTTIEIKHDNQTPFYNVTKDFINMPSKTDFVDTATAEATEHYYAILLHELIHSTGAKSRLDRLKPSNEKSKNDTAFEELIAELGAAMLCAKLGITQTPREDHAHYIKAWLSVLRDDKKHIFKASAQAARATEFLYEMQGEVCP